MMVVRKFLGDLTGRYLGLGGAKGDASNVLSVKGPGSLFDGDTEGHRTRINKATPDDTAAQTFEDGYSLRAVAGLLGDDDYKIKVSPDGAALYEGLKVDSKTGTLSAPSGFNQQGMLITDTLEPGLTTFTAAKRHNSRLSKTLQRADGSFPPMDAAQNYTKNWGLSGRGESLYGTTWAVYCEARPRSTIGEGEFAAHYNVTRILLSCRPEDRAIFNEVEALFGASYSKAPDFKVVASDDLAAWTTLHTYEAPNPAETTVRLSLTTPAKAYRHWGIEFTVDGWEYAGSDELHDREWVPFLNMRMWFK